MHAIPYHVWLATADPSGSILLGVLHCIIWPHLHMLALVSLWGYPALPAFFGGPD